ncbi:type VI secretion system baseplate subunit TssG [Mucilaginibacter sp. PAMB04168]|uniref:type VI secretion system baseplate subunit TssG n=1 Tax=Mucilaginibacter sp. PAMB04168 TaxID=3138567 RepID=UPI0031F6A7F8
MPALTDKVNLLDTDFKASTIAAGMVEADQTEADRVVILPQGAHHRAYAKEVANVTTYQSAYRNRTMQAIYINREGLYDMLPEGLFHQPPASSVMITEEEMVKDIKVRREEERLARNFFAPLEIELYGLRTVIELYETRLDKKSEYDELIDIFLKEWKEFKCFSNQQMIVLIHVLPVIHEQRNNLPFLRNVLSIMFNAPFELTYQTVMEVLKPSGEAGLGNQLGFGQLGVNLIAGNSKEPDEQLQITIGPLTTTQMLALLPGTQAAKALDVLLNYFVPMQTSVITHYTIGTEYQKAVLGASSENACLGFTTYLGS